MASSAGPSVPSPPPARRARPGRARAARRLRLDDADGLRRAYVDEGLSLAAIAERAGCSYATVRRALLANGVAIRRSGPPPIAKLRDPEWLRARVDEGLSTREIAALLSCAEATARSALQAAGLRAGEQPPRPPALDDPSFLRGAYVAEQRSVRSIAEELGCTKDAVLAALRRHGIAVRRRGRASARAVGAVLAVAPTPDPAEPHGEHGPAPEREAAVAPDPGRQADTEPAPEVASIVEQEAQQVGVAAPDAEEDWMVEPERGPERDQEREPAPRPRVTTWARPTPRPGAGSDGAVEDAAEAEARPALRPGGRGLSRIGAATVPPGRVDMEIQSIETRTFPIVRRGYDRAEVDAFLRAVAADYRQVVRTAREAMAAAQHAAAQPAPPPAAPAQPAPPPPAPTFEDVGAKVAAVLSSAAEAADEIRAAAEEEAAAIRGKAQEEADAVRHAAADEAAEARRLRGMSEEEAQAIVATARSDAATAIAAARQQAARLEQEAAERADTLERTARARVDAVLAEARRDYEHLRSVQQQCIDRLASVEFLAKHARDGLSDGVGQPVEELL